MRQNKEVIPRQNIIEAIVLSVVFLILGVVLDYFIKIQSLTHLSKQDIFAIGTSIFSMLIGWALGMSSLLDYQNRSSTIKYYMCIIVVAYIAMFADAMGCLMNGLSEYRSSHTVFLTFSNICNNFIAYFFWLYTVTYLEIGRETVKKFEIWIRGCLIIVVAARLLNIHNKMYFFVDENGFYYRGSFYILSWVYVSFLVISILILVILERKKLDIFKICVFFVAALLPIMGEIFVLDQGRVSFMPDPVMFCALLIYCILNVSHGRDMAVADRDLALASEIQEDSLPKTFPYLPERKEFDLFASMKAAKNVGGDFYDFFMIDEDHIALVIADVSGKGIPAALFMMKTKTLIKTSLMAGEGPAGAMFNVNQQLCEGNSSELFVTVWLSVVELSTGKGVSVNAGHLNPALKRAGGSYELIKYRHSLAVAIMENTSFYEREFTLAPGDELFVYTDGVTEARNTEGDLFGETGLIGALNSKEESMTPKETVLNVSEHLADFVNDAGQFDDITMLCMTYYGKSLSQV